MKQAVCLCLVTSDDKILAINRTNNPQGIGLIGGKVEPGENLLNALKREVFEETGLSLDYYGPFAASILTDIDGEFKTTTAIYFVNITSQKALEIMTEDSAIDISIPTREGQIMFCSFEELTNENKSPFAIYNQKVIEEIILLRNE